MKRFTSRVKYVWRGIFDEITIPEYISWWVVRLLFIYAVLKQTEGLQIFLFSVNALSLFAMPLIRFLVPKKSFIAEVPMRCQHLVTFMEFISMFLGNFAGAYSVIPKYDWLLHAISGPVAVIGGYFIYMAIIKKENRSQSVSPMLGTVFSASFSFVIITLWEIVEFFSDFFLGSENQGYRFIPGENDPFVKVFGHGAITDGAQFPLYDTMCDMTCAAVTTFIFSLAFFFIIKAVKKKSTKSEVEVKAI